MSMSLALGIGLRAGRGGGDPEGDDLHTEAGQTLRAEDNEPLEKDEA